MISSAYITVLHSLCNYGKVGTPNRHQDITKQWSFRPCNKEIVGSLLEIICSFKQGARSFGVKDTPIGNQIRLLLQYVIVSQNKATPM